MEMSYKQNTQVISKSSTKKGDVSLIKVIICKNDPILHILVLYI